MITISVCMLTKNNEQNIEPLLNIVSRFADEIIIADLGSSDNTMDIAKQFTPYVFSFEFKNDFSAARNYTFSLANSDYIMWLDINDIIDDTEIEKILHLKENADPKVDVYIFHYDADFDNNGYCTLTYQREGLLRRKSEFKWEEPVYEYIKPRGKIVETDIHIRHLGESSADDSTILNIYEHLTKTGAALSPRSTYYYAKELALHGKDLDAIDKYIEFLDSDGWIEDKIAACFELSFCYERTNNYIGMISALLESFEYAIPRAEICCRIGDYFIESNKLKEAVYWFETALHAEKPEFGGYIHLDYYGYIPHLWLCVLYYQLGDIEKAKYHNECAKRIKPSDPSVLYNQELFKSL